MVVVQPHFRPVRQLQTQNEDPAARIGIYLRAKPSGTSCPILLTSEFIGPLSVVYPVIHQDDRHGHGSSGQGLYAGTVGLCARIQSFEMFSTMESVLNNA